MASTPNKCVNFYSVITVHPEGTPLLPVLFQVAELLLTKVPVAATSLTQLVRQEDADISVASILM